MLSLPSLIIVNLIGQCVAYEATAVVNTTSGPVIGEISTSVHFTKYAAFKGIRFAEPPFGYLRFKPPVPVKPWTDVLNATVDGNDCPQFNGTASKVVGSEDCLFLNIYTPVTNLSQTPTKLKSVMVWIYGGAFVTGSAATTHNRPDFLIEKDVVFVSLNYRLGALGFLNIGHPNATGNAGLKDQNLALKWVQANIEKFGGNPKNVTIFGESAGAVSVGFQILSKRSEGLFHGAISMSGSPLVPWGFTKRADAIQRAETLARLVGAFPWTKQRYLEALYSATATQLIELGLLINPVVPFTPSLEDRSLTNDSFISDCSIDHYWSGRYTKVPQIMGFMDEETITFLNSVSEFLAVFDLATGLNKVVSVKTIDMLPKLALKAELEAKKVINVMDKVETKVHGKDSVVEGLGSLIGYAVNLTTDSLFKVQIDETQRFIVKSIGNVPIWYYDITYDHPRSRHRVGVEHSFEGPGHADDINYIFYIPANNYNLSMRDPMGRTIYKVSTMWTNFAKYGDPTPHWIDQPLLTTTWLPSGTSGQALSIGEELQMIPRPMSGPARLLGDLLDPLSPQLNDCF